MLSNLVTASTLLLLAVTLYFTIRAIVMLKGLTVPKEEKRPPKARKTIKSAEYDEMVRKANAVLENIENYNGSSYGQKEVK